MAAAQYFWKISYRDSNADPDYALSLSPVKTTVKFSDGTYRDLNGQTWPGSLVSGSAMLCETNITPGSPDTAAVVTATISSSPQVLPDDASHTAPRAQVDPYDVWLFTNSNGDVVASPRCSDVLNFTPYTLPVTGTPQPAVLGQVLSTPTNYLYVGVTGNVSVQLPPTTPGGAPVNQLLTSVAAGTLIEIAVMAVNTSGTTASAIFYW